ncbi:hypothetical protein VUR80DRAFT_4900 [Thermomyces stellatus]
MDSIVTMSADDDCYMDVPYWPPEWDFRLPIFFPVKTDRHGFRGILDAITEGASEEAIFASVASYGETEFRSLISSADFFDTPTIFWAVASGSINLVKFWIKHGASPSAAWFTFGPPLLAFAVVNPAKSEGDKAMMIAHLLSYGADPSAIPPEFYLPYCHDIPDDGPELTTDVDQMPLQHQWCVHGARKMFARSINLTHRYYFWKASRLKPPSERSLQIARLMGTEELFRIPYFLVGQSIACDRITNKVVSHVAQGHQNDGEPLVLLFAGPSGHGKTELAQKMGSLLGVPLHIVDCTSIGNQWDLFGCRKPYQNYQAGTPLNNFLA